MKALCDLKHMKHMTSWGWGGEDPHWREQILTNFFACGWLCPATKFLLTECLVRLPLFLVPPQIEERKNNPRVKLEKEIWPMQTPHMTE